MELGVRNEYARLRIALRAAHGGISRKAAIEGQALRVSVRRKWRAAPPLAPGGRPPKGTNDLIGGHSWHQH